MDELRNPILSGIQLELEESEEDGDEDIEDAVEGEGALHGPDAGLLYFFTRLYNVLSGYISMTTYVERRRRVYFAGFSNVQLLTPFLGDRQGKRYRWIHLSVIFHAFRSTRRF
ncbi:uncharacterized protein LOC6552007 [Drosophila erecta]|uniref:GG22570 n=1 Tax=Drosophila erecta TaxID=7220 RepID=B3P0E9_DROER|nr:uncharacterized protein LOC6552007 [Drosophila erecta]EDV48664.1 uncharacterized protein Dere_GG22570 [Drosophila erecta]